MIDDLTMRIGDAEYVLLERFSDGASIIAPKNIAQAKILRRKGDGGWQKYLDRWQKEGRF